MKRRIIKVLFLMVTMMIFSNQINSYAQENSMESSSNEKVNIVNNCVILDINDSNGTIKIENDYFSIESNFNSYILDGFAISYNKLILDCEDEKIFYLGLDFENNSLNYIAIIDEIYYYSSINFSDITCLVDLSSENVYNYLIQSAINTFDNDKYELIVDSATSAYVCFNFLRDSTFAINSRSANVGYSLTGDDDITEGRMNAWIDAGYINSNLFVTEGLHYGQFSSEGDNILRIYIIETEYNDFWKEYFSFVKIWKLIWDVTPQSDKSTKMVDLEFLTEIDIFIRGNESSGEFSTPTSGSSYVPIKSILVNFTTTNLAYINRYKFGYDIGDEIETPAYLSNVDNLLAKAVPYYEAVTTAVNGVINTVNNVVDAIEKMNFDNVTSDFSIENGDETTRNIGFELENTDIGNSIFSDQYLHNYSFTQLITVKNLPSYNISNYIYVKIVPLNNQSTNCSYSWNKTLKNNSSCSHQQNYVSSYDNIHIVSCTSCDYSFTECHDKSYENCGDSGHLVECAKCDYSSTKEHDLIIVTDGNSCSNCSYFVETIKMYVSNRDGMTHKVLSGGLTKNEACFGTAEMGGSEIRCIKCNQLLGTYNSLQNDDSEKVVMYVEKLAITKKEEE